MRANVKFGIILGVLIVLLLLAGSLIAFVYFNKDTAQDLTAKYLGGQVITQKTGEGSKVTKVSESVAVDTRDTETVINATAEKKEVNPEAQAEAGAKNFTKNFTERYGSFSNQNDFENIRNVMIYMTPAMESRAEKYIAEEKKASQTGAYYGITTKVLSSETQDFNDGSVTFKVKTQRKETSGVPAQTKNLSQSAIVKLKNEAGSWKVDEFTWL